MVTRSGWSVAGVSAVVFAAGWLLGYEELLAVGLAGLLVVAVALFWVAYRPNLEVHREIQPDRVTVGEPALGVLTLRNPGRRASTAMVAHEGFGADTLEIAVPRLGAGQSRATPYELPTHRRGVIPVGPLVLRRADPFGLVATGKTYGEMDTLWVHPRTHLIGALPSGQSRDLEGPTSDTAPQGGMAFHTLREYVHGDDLRQIHWRSTARTGTLMVRHMVDSSHPVTTVVLDTRRGRFEADGFELAVEAAASIVVACRRQNFPVRLHTTDGLDLGGFGLPVSTTDFLDHLAAVQWQDGGSLVDVAKVLASGGGGGSLVFLTGRPDLEDLPIVSRLRRNFDAAVVARFHDDVVITLDDGADRVPSGVPGAVVIDAGTADAFVASWNRLARP